MTKGVKLLVSKYEKITYEKLVAACRVEGAIVCPKVRVKDAIPIDESEVPKEQYSFALKSHFDFVITDKESNTLFAVEFDGPSHATAEAVRKDTLKDGLCERFGLPLLRISANHLDHKFRQWDLLSYFVDTWFLKRAFDHAQSTGIVPLDEDFDPMVVATGGGTRWPYWFSRPSQEAMRQLYKARKIAHEVPSILIGRDPRNNHRCLACTKISANEWAVAHTGMRSQLFDACTSDVIWQIGITELYENIKAILAARSSPAHFGDINSSIKKFGELYDICSAGGAENLIINAGVTAIRDRLVTGRAQPK